MPYIERNANGVIVSIKREPDSLHEEFMSPTNPEIVDFLTSPQEVDHRSSAKDTLSESDQDFARATEDLIHLLIQKNMILFTDLPPEVQTKMTGRAKLRSNLQNNPFNFLDDGESI